MKIFFLTIPRLTIIFSGWSPARAGKLLIQLYSFFFYTRVLKKEAVITLHILYKQCETSLTLTKYLDFAVLMEVFIYKEYDYGISFSTQSILDLGAHIGDTAIFYSGECPNAKIYAVEPSPESYSRLVKNTQSLPNVETFQNAIGLENKTVTLNLHEGSLGNSLYTREGDTSSVEVEQISIKELMQRKSITKFGLIKFDIEGAEFDLFKDPDFFTYAEAYIGELHYDLVPTESINELKIKLGRNVHIESLQKQGRFILKMNNRSGV